VIWLVRFYVYFLEGAEFMYERKFNELIGKKEFSRFGC